MRKEHRVDLLQGQPGAVRLLPFRLRRLGGHRSFGKPVYAASVTAAMGLASTEYGEDGYAEACDDLDVLLALDEVELWRQCQYVWPDEYLRVRVPALYTRQVNKRKADRTETDLKRPMRISTCYALRLAMMLPWFGAPAGNKNELGGATADRREGRRRAHARHDDNISNFLVDDMFDRFGERLVPFSAAETSLIERFVRAYGLKAEGMTWREIAGLWEAGPEGATRARLDRALGMAEIFSHGPAYRP
ncbi:MAG: hypothetical protein OXM58_05810 [Rhodospirillaceae bacterium]|nr:hypothetical protein [Rhodospirillaceae bacterium]MDE0619113.1 hypothetical protein [Rhodospirillaceae bacterium]